MSKLIEMALFRARSTAVASLTGVRPKQPMGSRAASGTVVAIADSPVTLLFPPQLSICTCYRDRVEWMCRVTVGGSCAHRTWIEHSGDCEGECLASRSYRSTVVLNGIAMGRL